MNQEEREAWLEERRKGLGGTDIAAIMMAGAEQSEKLGSFENSLFKLWSEKTGLYETEDYDDAILMRGRDGCHVSPSSQSVHPSPRWSS